MSNPSVRHSQYDSSSAATELEPMANSFGTEQVHQESLPKNENVLAAPEQVLPTLLRDGKRKWITPYLERGSKWNQRRWTAYGLIAFFVVLPHLRIAGKPYILLDIASREFTILGHTFFPTDTPLLALLTLFLLGSIMLLTSVAGRIWCGWGCPHTVYLEFLFRPIDRFFDGTIGKGGKPKKMVSGVNKVARILVYLLCSLFLAHTCLSYFVSTDELARWIVTPPHKHPMAFMVMSGTTLALMFHFLYFREQLCFIACPYGRFQSVMLDRHSLIVTYDIKRGEPRKKGKRLTKLSHSSPTKKSSQIDKPIEKSPSISGLLSDQAQEQTAAPEKNISVELPLLDIAAATTLGVDRIGDCIDCGRCTAVCPTGIDIRNGLQLECIHCTQCIDACNVVMDKIGLPRDLIGYSSQHKQDGGKQSFVRARTVIYLAFLSIVGTLFVLALMSKFAFDARILPSRGGAPFNIVANQTVQNNLGLRLTNRSQKTQSYSMSVVTPQVSIHVSDPRVGALEPGKSIQIPFETTFPVRMTTGRGQLKTQLRIVDSDGHERLLDFKLLGPK